MNGGGPPIPDLCLHENCNNCWRNYPQSRYPNWTAEQVKKSKIADAVERTQSKACISHYVDVDDKGHFINVEKFEAKPAEAEKTWKSLLDMKVNLSLLCERSLIHCHQAPIVVTDKSYLYWKTFWAHASDAGDQVLLLVCKFYEFSSLMIGLTLSLSSFLHSSIGFLPGLKLISNQESEIVSLLNTCFAERHIYDRSHNYSYISALCLYWRNARL